MTLTLDDFFTDYASSRLLFDALMAMVGTIGPVELAVTKSQVTLRRKKPFACAKAG